MRLSAYIAGKYNVSRKFVKQLIKSGLVKQNGAPVRTDIEISSGVEYSAEIPATEITYEIADYHIKLYDEVLFIYKPPFMHSERLTPADALCLDDIISAEYPDYSLISRLDYGVDGIIAAVRDGIQVKTVQKRYLAWVEGGFPAKNESRWLVDADKRRKVRAFQSDDGSRMKFRRIKESGGMSLIEVELETAGRHQVRAVCAALGYPILGDSLYGNGEEGGRIFLHCSYAEVNGISAESPFAKEFSRLPDSKLYD